MSRSFRFQLAIVSPGFSDVVGHTAFLLSCGLGSKKLIVFCCESWKGKAITHGVSNIRPLQGNSGLSRERVGEYLPAR